MEWWNGGIMEYWDLKAEFILILISVLPAVLKKDLFLFNPLFLPRENFFHISLGPIFQYSIIPGFRFSA
jgi:hypothetical protein